MWRQVRYDDTFADLYCAGDYILRKRDYWNVESLTICTELDMDVSSAVSYEVII